MVGIADAQAFVDMADGLNQVATALRTIQQGLAPTDPDNDILAHLIATLEQQALACENDAVELALAIQGDALASMKAATAYLKQQTAIIGDVNTAISVAGGLAALAAAVLAHDPAGVISAASTLIGLIGAAKASPSGAPSP
jgi:hypothetical protein